jgi:hypothetical protein
MRYLLILFVLISSFTFVSCKKDAKPKACFTFSKNRINPNDTVYILNCSENYKRFYWISAGLLLIDSTNRHIKLAPSSPGSVVVALRVGDENLTFANSADIGSIQIDSFKVQ